MTEQADILVKDGERLVRCPNCRHPMRVDSVTECSECGCHFALLTQFI